MKPLLKEITLSDLSRIEVHYYKGAANVKFYQTILVIAYSGEYGFGS
ncbi:hypothetical protein ACX93W_27040 [Paenibacillus sp. CAU 1782]